MCFFFQNAEFAHRPSASRIMRTATIILAVFLLFSRAAEAFTESPLVGIVSQPCMSGVCGPHEGDPPDTSSWYRGKRQRSQAFMAPSESEAPIWLDSLRGTARVSETYTTTATHVSVRTAAESAAEVSHTWGPA